MRLFAVSATATPPAGSSAMAATARAIENSPGVRPNPPNVPTDASVAASNTSTRLLRLSETYSWTGGRAATAGESGRAQVATLGLMSLSPISAFVSSMLNFDNRNDMLRFSFNPAGPASSQLWPAPFVILTVLYLLIAIVLLILAARRLSRIDP